MARDSHQILKTDSISQALPLIDRIKVHLKISPSNRLLMNENRPREREHKWGRITMLQTDPHLWRLLATFNTLAGWLGPFERESEQVRAFISSALMQILKGKDALGQGPCNECGLHAQPSLAKPYRFQWTPVSETSQPQVFQSVTSGRSFSCSRRASTPSLHRGVHLCS